jgi:hypothetical protein
MKTAQGTGCKEKQKSESWVEPRLTDEDKAQKLKAWGKIQFPCALSRHLPTEMPYTAIS